MTSAVADGGRSEGAIALTGLTFATRAGVFVLSLAASVLAARLLGPAGKGQLAVATTWPFLVATLGLIGGDVAATFAASEDPRQAWPLTRLGLVYAAIVGIPLAAVYGSIVWFRLFSDLPLLAALSVLYVPITMVATWVTCVFVGSGRLPFVNLVGIASALGYVLFLGLLTAAHRANAAWVLAGSVAMQAISLLVLTICARRARSTDSAAARVPRAALRKFGRYAIRAYPSSAIGLLQLKAPLLLLTTIVTAREVGFYAVAQSVSDVLYLLPVSVGTVLLPRVVASGSEAAQKTTERASRLSLSLVLAACLAGSLLIPLLLSRVFGSEFGTAVSPALILLPSTLFYCLTRVLSSFFSGIDKPGIPSSISVAGLAVSVTLVFLLAPAHGALGAAIAMVASQGVTALLLVVAYCRIPGHSLSSLLIVRPRELLVLWRTMRKMVWPFRRRGDPPLETRRRDPM